MSYELADAHVADMQASVWTLTKATFTGAAILLREKAAYSGTSFRLRRTQPGSRMPMQRALGSSAEAGARRGWLWGVNVGGAATGDRRFPSERMR